MRVGAKMMMVGEAIRTLVAGVLGFRSAFAVMYDRESIVYFPDVPRGHMEGKG